MKREDYLFCIGFHGDTAIVDKQARAKYGKLTTEQLVGEGLFKAAFCSALYSGVEDEIARVITGWNELAGSELTRAEEMKRLLGISDPPEHIAKILTV